MATSFALLAPVPLVRLEAAVPPCHTEEEVAFGTRAWQVFDALDDLRGDVKVPVQIYASHDPKQDRLEVSWKGQYVRQVRSRAGRHPEPKYRPCNTQEEDAISDPARAWAVFWHVRGLHRLGEEACIPIREFVGLGKGKPYKKGFIPERPLIVEPLE